MPPQLHKQEGKATTSAPVTTQANCHCLGQDVDGTTVTHRLFTTSDTHAACRDGWEKNVCHRCTYHLSPMCFTVTITFSITTVL